MGHINVRDIVTDEPNAHIKMCKELKAQEKMRQSQISAQAGEQINDLLTGLESQITTVRHQIGL